MAKVLKAFNSNQRRFREGDEVSASDDLSPHDYADLVARDFLTEERTAGAPARTRRKD